MKTASLMLAAFALTGVAACTTSGVGTASTPNGDTRATLSWNSSGGRSGTMTAQISNGQTYSGTYFQITHDTQVAELGPLWAGWGGPWRGPWGWRRPYYGGWGYWGPDDAFVTAYTGRVVANLAGPDNTHLRCRFDLIHPGSGMAGGGQGSCQMPDGKVIDAVFPEH